MTLPGATNVAAYLASAAAEHPYRLAVVCPHRRDRAGRASHTHLTFRQLDEESNRLARGLQAVGIGRGTRTVLMVRPSLEFFALTFALFRAGCVPVLVDPGMGVRNLGQCLREAQPEAFIGIPKAHLARILFRWARGTLQRTVTVGPRWLWGGLGMRELRALGDRGPPVMEEMDPDETAAILFTSGSTGVPKGAVYTHRIFAGQVEAIRDTFQIEPGEIDLTTFPLFALFAPALRMTAIIPDMDASRPAHADPRKIIGAVEDFGATNLFASPALLRRLADYGAASGVYLPSLRRVISAGAPVHAPLLERFVRLLAPGVQVFTPYGATEAMPVASIGSETILSETRKRTELGAGVCVGRPVAGIDVRIIRITDEPIARWFDALQLPAGQIGEIVVRGPVVTRAYYNREESTRLAKIAEGDGFWHRMGDVGSLDEQGRLWICGRKSHRVETVDGTLFTLCCEAIFNAHPAVNRTALVGVGPRGRQRPVLCVELHPHHRRDDRAKLRRELLALGAAHDHTRVISDVLFHRAFPVDIRHNAKIFREQLSTWAEGRLK